VSGPARRPTPFGLAVAAASLLVTLVMATAIWDSSFPGAEREALRERRAYYERTLRRADVSWHPARFYRTLDGAGGAR